MGKRSNRDAAVGRRRPMIQLGSQKSGIGVVSRTNFKEEETIKEEPTTDKIDAELAGFLAEINSLESSSSYDVPDATSKQTNGDDKTNLIYDPTTFDPATQGHLLPEPWQACYDESTSYYYYWNTSTNEVQWYPPVSSVPPPPPPPPDETPNPVNLPKEPEIAPSDSKGEIVKDVVSENEDALTNKKDNEKIEKQEVDNVKEETDTDSKIKDRELMSQIKEKIQRKKEEKILQKNLEKQNKNEQKDKEEQLREKLILKKIEREKVISSDTLEDTAIKKEEVSGKNIGDSESFSVDIFANEDISKMKPKLTDEAQDIKHTEVENVQPTDTTDDFKQASDQKTESTDCETDEPIKKSEENQKDLKGSWRIIDAVYDDDDAEDNSDANNVESDAELSVKSAVEMDDYADMLLEDGIGDKEDEQNKINSNAKETIEPVLPPEMPPLPQDDIKPPLPPEDEPIPEPPKTSPEQEEKARKEIGEKSTQLFEKLDFLGISSNDLRSLQLHFIELETRMKDWQAGALDSQYFLKTLSDLDSQILKYEETAAPTGWLCHWSSEFKRYYYHNTLTGESQWEYPEVAHTGMTMNATDYHTAAAQMMSIQAAMMNPMMSYMSAAMTTAAMAPVVSTSMEKPVAISETTASLVSPAHGFSREPVPSETKKRAAQDDSTTDPYRKKKKEMTTENSSVGGNESGPSSPLPKSVIAAAPVIRNTSREASPAINTSSFISDDRSEGSASPLPLPTAKMTVANAKAKLKKKKKPETSGLPSKKLKQVSSLVQKWQTVKQKVEEEEQIEEESEEEDYEAQSERRINEWKRELELSGKKEFNPNFTEIKGNWRERLKRKTTS